MAERLRRSGRAPEHLQTTFLAPEDATLVAELTRLRLLMSELTARYGRQIGRGKGELAVTIRSPKDVADLLMAEMQELPQEEFRAVLLNAKNHIIIRQGRYISLKERRLGFP